MTDISSKPLAEFSQFLNFCKEASIAILQTYLIQEKFEVHPLSPPPLLLGHWMSAIILTSPVMRVTFRTHFMTEDGKVLVATSFSKNPEEVLSMEVLDFFKEYCNMVAGKIKWLLEFNGTESGISLPVMLRGFDEVFFKKEDRKSLFSEKWKLQTASLAIACSIIVEFEEGKSWDDLKLNYTSDYEESEVTFL